ncbi:MAG: glycoside hydrolase [Calditrichaeota bacterium]|nr:glycoside hydrolase [Calditrichota bacterium]
MSLKKQYLKSKSLCRVTFRLEKKPAAQAKKVYLVGDFNNWDEKANPMKKLSNGDFTLRLDLETGKQYQFRYLLDDGTWENDWNADQYVSSQFPGTDNSVVLT